MKIYEIIAGCLVDDIVIKLYVRAKNEKRAFIKAYCYALNNPVIDSGDIDIKHIKTPPKKAQFI